MPSDSVWENTFNGKMIYLQTVPDFGPIKKRWIMCKAEPTDTYYTSVEDDILKCFDEGLNKAFNDLEDREKIFNDTRIKIRELFSAANSYVNFLYDKYEERLKRWLFVDQQITLPSITEDMFGDYEPKTSPDTILDYMPELHEEIIKLPDAVIDNFVKLASLLKLFKEKAAVNPGHWEDGNMILGAQPKTYLPTKDELLAAEVGNRLAIIIDDQSKGIIQDPFIPAGIGVEELTYKKYSFIHFDVMGSGRFYYVNEIEEIELTSDEQK